MNSDIEGSIIAYQQVEIETLKERVAQLESQLPDGMQHCTITFHQCAKGHGWLSATNWIQHGCSKCERDRLEEGVQALRDVVATESMEKYVEREFQKNLELAQEELAMTAPDDLPPGYHANVSERSAWNMAVEWTQDDIANTIGRQLEQKWWAKQDAINKAHFD